MFVINNVPGGHTEFKIIRSRTSSDYYLVWKDGRRINVAYDIYAQKLNNLGQPQWTPNGIKVSGTPILLQTQVYQQIIMVFMSHGLKPVILKG